MAAIYQPSRRKNLYIRYRSPDGGWKSKATPFLPGQEADALAFARKLEGTVDLVHDWAQTWLERRREAGVQDVENDEARLRDHVLPTIGALRIDEVTPAQMVAFVDAMKKKGLAPRTVRNVYSVARALFRDAMIEGLSAASPCILTHRQLGKLRDKDLGWRAGAVFTRTELEMLIGDPRIPLFRRVLWGLLGVAGLRDGEACALRWGRVLATKPLPRLVIVASNGRDTTKTETERWMPVHPVLEELLTDWKYRWQIDFERFYREEDLVLPAPLPTNRGPRKPYGAMLDKNWIWKRLQADLRILGMRPRRAHDLRRTLISLAKADGAQEYILRRGTHSPPKDVMELYTSVEWEALCTEVAKLKLIPRTDQDVHQEDPDLARMFRV